MTAEADDLDLAHLRALRAQLYERKHLDQVLALLLREGPMLPPQISLHLALPEPEVCALLLRGLVLGLITSNTTTEGVVFSALQAGPTGGREG